MSEPPQSHRRRLPKPIQQAVQQWLDQTALTLPQGHGAAWRVSLVEQSPKRFTVYEPMLLLPSGSFSTPAWKHALASCDASSQQKLWLHILATVSKTGPARLTHLAVLESIPLRKQDSEKVTEDENILRSPTGLKMLHGDFGPDALDPLSPSEEDFDKTLWVSTKQNGIHQVWAPKWTMFSRGNVKEKARLLAFETAKQHEWAVDLYAGIGYFAFCYAALGFRVLCWEINPWSVEGLRRGAAANGWSISVLTGDALLLPQEDLMELAGDARIVVFLEDNQRALQRVRAWQTRGRLRNSVVHVNCGYLPSSEPTWRLSWGLTAAKQSPPQAWLHLHENVGADDIDERKAHIQEQLASWMAEQEEEEKATPNKRVAKVVHVERVKTFAPGVWHCVFDVQIDITT